MGSGMCGYISRLPWRVAAAMQALDGRFQFLWGIYKAHSRSEDEIVFPALESKQALRNVSHAYTLDHQEEEKQFSDLEQVMATLRSAPDVATARSSTLAARRMCAAVRASLETHIRAEEAELWPLFTEHFSTDEQQYLVGVIIGRTGAQVLQALLPWISGSFSLEDKEMMMGSLRQATKNTMFDQWLDAVTSGTAGGSGSGNEAVAGAAQTDGSNDNNNNNNSGGGGHVLEHPTPRTRYQEDTIDPDLARYLSISPAPGKEKGRNSTGPCSSGSGVKGRDGPAEELPVESSTFRPGWEDIFRMNQKQLEAAVMRVSADPNLEPGRKAYLIQNIMVSKYIVAQQRRMQEEQEEEGSSFTGASPNDGAAAGADPARFQGRAPRRTYHDAAQGILGCKHYKRRTQLVAPCCDQVFTCRLCHDEAMPSHRMDRSAVREMVCMECGTRQPVGSHCARCATQMARYYCNICHLFDDQEGRDIYHCPFCNVCRRGRGLGIDFFHCMSCNACMSLSLFKVHNCREKAMESNCPVCSEFLFDSADSIKELPCGHFMHTRCFAEYTRYNYTCPICSKSVGDMHVYFQMLDSLLASERLPPEYAGRMQQVLCNDCGKTGFTRFHWAYHSCPHCRSYNTRLL
uniref:Uncharacterized protein n=2 Tax=Dunaliella tertiolecta TaxID=3047 RepID=A0A7S3R8J5_DUNTE